LGGNRGGEEKTTAVKSARAGLSTSLDAILRHCQPATRRIRKSDLFTAEKKKKPAKKAPSAAAQTAGQNTRSSLEKWGAAVSRTERAKNKRPRQAFPRGKKNANTNRHAREKVYSLTARGEILTESKPPISIACQRPGRKKLKAQKKTTGTSLALETFFTIS